MDLSADTLLVSLLIGSVGLGLFLYGRKRDRLPHLIVGIVLMAYPYFVPGALWQAVVGAGLLGGLYGLTRLGW